MIGFVTKNKKAIVCQLKCWQGRTVLLYRSTLIGHVIRLHLESAFVVEELKRKFNQPMCVVKNVRHGTLNAFYDITTNGQPFLLVSVEIQKRLPKMVGKPHFIKTFYGVDALPPGPYEWERKS
jgi:hypothetical protein